MLRVGLDATAATATTGCDALRELLAPDFALVDRRPIGFGTLDHEQFRTLINASVEMGLQVGRVKHALHIVGNAILAVMDVHDVTEQHSEYGRASCVVLTIDSSGRIDRMEGFDITQFDATLARLDELGAAGRRRLRRLVENQLSRGICAAFERLNRGERDTTSGGPSPHDVVRVDRGRGVSAPTVLDEVGYMAANAAALRGSFGTVTPEVVAVHGERLALIRLHCGDAVDGFELELLCVFEANDDGQLVPGRLRRRRPRRRDRRARGAVPRRRRRAACAYFVPGSPRRRRRERTTSTPWARCSPRLRVPSTTRRSDTAPATATTSWPRATHERELGIRNIRVNRVVHLSGNATRSAGRSVTSPSWTVSTGGGDASC